MLKADIVVPCFNEEKVLKEFYRELSKVLFTLELEWTIIFVNDGSTDNSQFVINSLVPEKNISEIKLLNLSKNLGHMIALREGLKLGKGVFTISLDCDLQDPPEFISKLVQEYMKSDNCIDCIIGKRENRVVDSFTKKHTAKAYYWLARKFISSNIVQDAADYRLITSNFRSQLLNYIGPYPIYRVLIPLSTNKLKVLNYTRNFRHAGKSKYNYKKMFQLASLSFFYFSRLPLNILNALVFFSISFNVFIFCYILYANYFAITVPGWSSNVFILSLSMLLVIIFINIFGKYTYHNFLTSQGLPLISVKEEEGRICEKY